MTSDLKKPDILLVHGGMHGGWCWRRVMPLLAAAGHDVHCPTLTGLGSRAHLGGRTVDLSLHIEDIMRVVETEELTDFLLVGHSYAGMVISGVADRRSGNTLDLLYLDALVPADGEAAADLVPRNIDYATFADGMLPVIPGYDFGLNDPADTAWVRRRVTPQSVRTVTEPIRLTSDLSPNLDRMHGRPRRAGANGSDRAARSKARRRSLLARKAARSAP